MLNLNWVFSQMIGFFTYEQKKMIRNVKFQKSFKKTHTSKYIMYKCSRQLSGSRLYALTHPAECIANVR